MTTLGLSVVTNSEGSREIVAKKLDTDCSNSVSGNTGDIEGDEGTQVIWKNCGENWQGTGTHTFLVTFERKGLFSGNWPFKPPKKPKDATLIVPPPFEAGTNTTLKKVLVPKQTWEYTAMVQQDSSIAELDPKIIIRNKNSFEAVALAVTAVIVVAAAIYLLRRKSVSR
jgi:hypothetical protein